MNFCSLNEVFGGCQADSTVLVECAVASITSIKWSSAPFDSLALPPEQKELVKALAEARMATGSGYGFDDVVEGKGQCSQQRPAAGSHSSREDSYTFSNKAILYSIVHAVQFHETIR